MERNFFDRLAGLSDQEKIAFRKRALIFLFFLALSVVFWLLTALSKNYTTSIEYPVRYRNVPQDKILVGDLPESLLIKVNAHGYSILRNKLSARYIPISISLNDFTLKPMPGSDTASFYLETRATRDRIASQLSSEFGIIDIDPDTLYFRFAKLKTKKVRVEPRLEYQLDKQLILKNPISSSPDSVLVSGPDFIVDTLRQVRTEHISGGLIRRNMDEEAKLEKLSNLYFERSNVLVTAEVEKYTEKLLKIPVEVINVPDSLIIRTFPYFVELSCQVGLSKFEKLQPTMFRATADLNDVQLTQGTRLNVRLTRQPDFVMNVRYSPNNVEYLIERK